MLMTSLPFLRAVRDKFPDLHPGLREQFRQRNDRSRNRTSASRSRPRCSRETSTGPRRLYCPLRSRRLASAVKAAKISALFSVDLPVCKNFWQPLVGVPNEVATISCAAGIQKITVNPVADGESGVEIAGVLKLLVSCQIGRECQKHYCRRLRHLESGRSPFAGIRPGR